MTEIKKINGYHIYNSFISGYENLLTQKQHLNDINVFPVADGDTGNNMVATISMTLQISPVSQSLSETLFALGDRALSAARGNSGIILAQFVNDLARECPPRESVTCEEFGGALARAAAGTEKALEDPREGTLLTVLKVWTVEIDRLLKMGGSLREHFVASLAAAQAALKETTNQLEVLKRAKVVDAGASGFVVFLEGIARALVTGRVSWEHPSKTISLEDAEEFSHDLPESSDQIPYRYCAEALLLTRRTPEEDLRLRLSTMGDSLIVSHGRNKTKIHIHTNYPSEVFFELKEHGRISEQKVDDMIRQSNAIHHPVSPIAVVTDSIADIPAELIDRYQIHVIPLRIIWGENEYLDRLTLDTAAFYPYLDSRKEYPGSSVPSPISASQLFSWLAPYYQSIIAIPVGKALSGTWQVMNNAAEPLRKRGHTITVIDSRLNSAAQGLVVLSAAEDAANGLSYDSIIQRTKERIQNARILVSVATFKYMIRGGRVSALKGAIATLAHLKPIVTLDADGKGVAYGASFSQKGSMKKIMANLVQTKKKVHRYAVVHAAVPDAAQNFAREAESMLGYPPEYIMEISPIVGIHAGIGAVAVAWI
jgi:uncharacterized protein